MKTISFFLNRIYLKVKPYVTSERSLAILFFAGMLLITLPMYVAGAYSHPATDDYTFCFNTYRTANAYTGLQRIFRVIGSAFGSVKEIYLSWSGYYTGTFLGVLRPNFFNENLAFFNSFIILTGLIGCIFLACHKIFHIFLGFSKSIGCIFSCTFIVLITQFVPSAAETIYWYTAGITYTLLFAVGMLFLSNVLIGAYKEGMGNLKWIGNILLALIVAGGILPVNIPLLGMLTLVLIDLFFGRLVNKDKSLKVKIAVIYAVFLAGMLIGSLSPGTFLRLEGLGESNTVSLPYAIIYSIYGSLSTVVGFITPSLVIGMAGVVAITIYGLKNCTFEFRHPILFSVLAWCVFFAAYFPIYFGTGYKIQHGGDSRYNSIIFFHFILWTGFLTVYWTGWLYQRLNGNRQRIILLISLIGLFLLATIATKERREPWSIHITKDFINGTIQQYDEEMDKRYADLMNPDISIVTFDKLTATPSSIYLTEPKAGTWSQSAIERYFSKTIEILE